jgi:nucleotide-binding universal stress UspA family protein
MHLLICAGGERQSRDTLKLGIRLASALRADLSVLYVQPPSRPVALAESGSTWTAAGAGRSECVETATMRAIVGLLREGGLLPAGVDKARVRHPPKEIQRGVCEYHLYSARGENIRIRERQGDVIQNVRMETQEVRYDLVVVGAPGDEEGPVRQIIQAVDTSVLVVKNPRDVTYRLLLCMSNPQAARRAQDFAVRAASLLDTAVDVLCIFAYPWEEDGALNLIESSVRLLKHFRISHSVRLRRGPLVRTILREATPGHIIVMGAGEGSSAHRALAGGVPAEVTRRGVCSVLLVK